MKKILITLVVLGLLAVAVYLYVFHKPHRDVTSESAEFQISATTLMDAYTSNSESANSLYLDNVVEVQGVVAETNSDGVILEGGIVCHFLEGENHEDLKVGSEVAIKGRVVGYDDLFGEVRLDNCHMAE